MSSHRTILIAGGSGSGKSTLALGLARRLPGATLFPVDAYYRDLSHLPPERRAAANFDDPGAIEIDLLIPHLTTLRSGERISQPVYDFTRHIRLERTRAVRAAGPILVEGMHALHWPELRAAGDVTLFVRAPEAVRLERRVARDVCDRGREEQAARRQFSEAVAPMHARFVEPTARFAHFVLDGSEAPEALIEKALQRIVG